jgi:hypothetical protein
MLSIDELKTVFRSCYFERSAGTLLIQETEKDAAVKSAAFETEGDLLHIRKEFLDASKELYIRNNDCTGIELEHCCDGIVLLSEKDKMYVFLIELKSKYTKDNVKKAYNQLRASYLKLVTTLFAFKDFQLSDCCFAGILVSLPMEGETMIKYQKLLSVEQDKSSFNYFKFCMDLNFHGELFVQKEHLKYQSLPLKEELFPEELPLFYVEDWNSPIDLDVYKRRLIKEI